LYLVFEGISEGVFAFFIVFSALAGMATGAYLMDKNTFLGKTRQFVSGARNKLGK
jgi:hypothetical protein